MERGVRGDRAEGAVTERGVVGLCCRATAACQYVGGSGVEVGDVVSSRASTPGVLHACVSSNEHCLALVQ